MMEDKAAIKKAIGEFDPTTGIVPNLLHNMKYTSELRGRDYVLLDPKGNMVTLNKPSKKQSAPKEDKDWN